jgi:hypothetical protein
VAAQRCARGCLVCKSWGRLLLAAQETNSAAALTCARFSCPETLEALNEPRQRPGLTCAGGWVGAECSDEDWWRHQATSHGQRMLQACDAACQDAEWLEGAVEWRRNGRPAVAVGPPRLCVELGERERAEGWGGVSTGKVYVAVAQVGLGPWVGEILGGFWPGPRCSSTPRDWHRL